jgi:hypothetical protein
MTAPDAEHPCPRHLSVATVIGIFATGASTGVVIGVLGAIAILGGLP